VRKRQREGVVGEGDGGGVMVVGVRWQLYISFDSLKYLLVFNNFCTLTFVFLGFSVHVYFFFNYCAFRFSVYVAYVLQ
jgi:hypothetical protein